MIKTLIQHTIYNHAISILFQYIAYNFDEYPRITDDDRIRITDDDRIRIMDKLLRDWVVSSSHKTTQI